ncbi:hypothetical protein E2C01_017605 [Portunus trituberculatus]|uniref:Uncharacterized protein n=1 Tax=Portunus trituberculatus TaxID=210409 RepID=A0A5B7DSE1_PORTR|nr:hypothetical protein [Portunus trituberculatus]
MRGPPSTSTSPPHTHPAEHHYHHHHHRPFHRKARQGVDSGWKGCGGGLAAAGVVVEVEWKVMFRESAMHTHKKASAFFLTPAHSPVSLHAPTQSYTSVPAAPLPAPPPATRHPSRDNPDSQEGPPQQHSAAAQWRSCSRVQRGAANTALLKICSYETETA